MSEIHLPPGMEGRGGQMPPIFTTIKRDVYTAVNAMGVGELEEMLPDMTFNLQEPTVGLQIVVLEGGVQRSMVFFLGEQTKADLIRLLSGVEIATELPRLQGLNGSSGE